MRRVFYLIKDRDVPIYLNSPMAIRATEIFHSFHREHKLSDEECELIDATTTIVRTVEESKALVEQNYPCVIISASRSPASVDERYLQQ